MATLATLALPKTLHFRSLQQAIGAIGLGSAIDSLDFQQVQWVQPSGMASLAALVRLLRESGEVIAINARQSRAFRYFQDMDFFSSFGLYPDEDFNRRQENRAFARMVEVTDQTNSSAVARNLAKIVSEHGRPIHNDLFTCLEESVRNVIDWSGKPGFAVAQTQNVWGGERTYNIAIADYGWGIQSVLSRNPRYAQVDERHALLEAVKKGVTTATPGSSDNFGEGLFQIDRITESTFGRFILASGAWVRIRQGDAVRLEPITRWRGTVVEVTLYLSGLKRATPAAAEPRRLRFG